jgi:hypothetical protein
MRNPIGAMGTISDFILLWFSMVGMDEEESFSRMNEAPLL